MIQSVTIMKGAGFTLIEVLVTIAIVVILASLGLSNFNQYRSKVEDTKTRLYFQQIRTAMESARSQMIDDGNCLDSGICFDNVFCNGNNGEVIHYTQNLKQDSSYILSYLSEGFATKLASQGMFFYWDIERVPADPGSGGEEYYFVYYSIGSCKGNIVMSSYDHFVGGQVAITTGPILFTTRQDYIINKEYFVPDPIC